MIYLWLKKGQRSVFWLSIVVLLSFNPVKGMEKPDPDPPADSMTASQVHLRSLMADIKNDPSYYHKDFKEVLEEFFKAQVAKGFSQDTKDSFLDVESHLRPYFQKKIQAVLEEESMFEQRQWYTVYHAMNIYYAFVMDIMTELRKFLDCNQSGEHTVNFRTLWKSDYLNLKTYIREKVKDAEGPDNLTTLTLNFRSFGSPDVLSINFFLFGSNGAPLEYTLRYWFENYSHSTQIMHKKSRETEIIENLLRQHVTPILEGLELKDGVDEFIKQCIELYEESFKSSNEEESTPEINVWEYDDRMRELATATRKWTQEEELYYQKVADIIENNKKMAKYRGGRLLAIHINPDVIDVLTYVGPHFPLPWENNDNGKTSKIIGLIKKDPTAFQEKLNKLPEISSLWKNYLGSNSNGKYTSNNLFGVLFPDKNYAYNEQYVQTSIFDLFFKDEEKASQYKESIHQLVSVFLGKNYQGSKCTSPPSRDIRD